MSPDTQDLKVDVLLAILYFPPLWAIFPATLQGP